MIVIYMLLQKMIFIFPSSTSHPYTLASRSKSHRTNQNLPKSMPAPTHGRQKQCSKLKGKMTENKEHQPLTSGIKHWGLSGYANVLPRIKFGVTGQVCSPQSPTISYRQPLAFMQKNDTT
jgi:hypothetical protein